MDAGDLTDLVHARMVLEDANVLGHGLDGDDTARRTLLRSAQREITDVCADVDDHCIRRYREMAGPEIRVQDERLVHDAQVPAARANAKPQSITQLENDGRPELGGRDRPPVAVNRRSGERIPKAMPPLGTPDPKSPQNPTPISGQTHAARMTEPKMSSRRPMCCSKVVSVDSFLAPSHSNR